MLIINNFDSEYKEKVSMQFLSVFSPIKAPNENAADNTFIFLLLCVQKIRLDVSYESSA